MRHGKVNRKFHRKKGQRVALLKGLMSNLILKEKIQMQWRLAALAGRQARKDSERKAE